MKENNASKFSAVAKHIEDVLQSNPTIDMVSVV